jgi:hypothetical protein
MANVRYGTGTGSFFHLIPENESVFAAGSAAMDVCHSGGFGAPRTCLDCVEKTRGRNAE